MEATNQKPLCVGKKTDPESEHDCKYEKGWKKRGMTSTVFFDCFILSQLDGRTEVYIIHAQPL